MIMTNSPSIQDVLFFPQMRPEQAEDMNPQSSVEVNRLEGVREDLIPVLQKLGIHSKTQMKEMKPSKLFNDVCGMRKKMKLEVPNPTLQEVEEWLK
jgi:lysyl-tRNA synthetase class 2